MGVAADCRSPILDGRVKPGHDDGSPECRTFAVAPHFARDFDATLELAPLVGLAEVVAVHGRGEAALVAERALLDRHVFRRFVDAPLDLVLGLGRGMLGAHQAEDDRLAFRREAQRREVARALVVVFEEKAVDLHFVEQNIGDRLIAALGDPGALEIAAAEMDRDRHVLRPVADRVIDQPAVELGERVGIVAAGARALADGRVAEIGEIGVVELQVAAAARRQIGDLVAIGGGEVDVEWLEVGIDALADRLPAAAEMQHRRRRDADLRRLRHDALEEVEVGALDRLDVADLAFDVHRRRLEADLAAVVLAELGDELAVVGLDAVEPLEEIDVEIRAAELAVGDPLEADVLLRAHDLADARVLDCAQCLGRQGLGERLLARRPQAFGPEKAADMVGAERRLGHRNPP